MSNILRETVEEVLVLGSYNTGPYPQDHTEKIVSIIAYFGLACIMDSSVRQECEEFWANYRGEDELPITG